MPVNPLRPTVALAERADQRAVRASNLSLVVRQLTDGVQRSRAQIATVTGLNKTTVSSLVAELIERGMVSESGLESDGTVGRPATMLELDDGRLGGLGLEINVDYLAASVCDLRGRLRHHAVVSHDNRGSEPARVIAELADMTGAALEHCIELGMTPIGAGISIPGVIEHATGMLWNAPNLGWHGFDVAEELRGALASPSFPLRTDNDANLAALGELESGALRGVRQGLLVFGGVGIGGAVIIDGQLYRGTDGFAGEIGHIPVRPFDGVQCQCGAIGCLETLVGQEAIAAMVGIQRVRTEGATPAVLLAAQARAGNAGALAALAEVAQMLAIGLAGAINTTNPERIVLGGTLATLGEWLVPAVSAALIERVPPLAAGIDVAVSELGEQASVRGAAALVLHELIADPTRTPTL